MKPIVIDANVAIKWLLPHRPEEADVSNALLLFGQIETQQVLMLQPPHFFAEVMAVVARLEPDYADRVFLALRKMEIGIIDRSEVYRSAIRLSINLKHHLFDTLYHAVAIETSGATLITADETYYRKAQGLGHILLLQNYSG
ncbi:type II toxin-antitoxin system VapC family toxin [Methyloglobulus sp.]|uniref:type II toxin-antitoxin system VapC family toxin n=1 Tax=Methyloglobulus sp. TaxID=2518622 RepID=UPI003989C889